jgi:ABC-type uncharacterized transport system involved in gliding motility auxiliary subunit
MTTRGPGRRVLGRIALALLAIGFVAFCALLQSGLGHHRLDLTADRRHTLSEGTRRIANSLAEPVHLRLYWSRAAGESSPYLAVYATRVRELLAEIAAASGGRVRLSVVDPAPFSADEDDAAEAGLTALPLGDAAGTQAWFGLVGTNSTDGRQVLPLFRPEREAFLEYDIARLLLLLARPQKPPVGLVTALPMTLDFDPGSGRVREPWAVLGALRETFDVRPIAPDATALPQDLRVLVVAHPQRLSEPLLRAIERYVLAGGRLLLFVDPSAEQAAPAEPNAFGPGPPTRASDLAPLLAAWGVGYDPRQVLGDDAQALAVAGGPNGAPVRHLGFLGVDAAHMSRARVATATLRHVNVATAGVLVPNGAPGTTFEPLLWSSDTAAPLDAARFQDLRDPATLYAGFKPTGERYTIAAYVSGRPASAFAAPGATPARASRDVRVVVVADTDLLADLMWTRTETVFGQRYPAPFADNGDFVLNTVDWLAGSEDLVSLRGRATVHRPFERVDDLRRRADEQLREQAAVLERALADTDKRLAALEAARGDATAGGALAQQAELRRFQEERLRVRRELREVRRGLDRDIESLGRTLKLLNILVLPLLLVGLLAWLTRRRSRRA